MLLLFETGGYAMKDTVCAGLGARSARRRPGARIARGVPRARSRATAQRRATPSRWRGSPACNPTASGVSPAPIAASLARMWSAIAPKIASGRAAVISGASGAEPATAEERAWLSTVPALPVRATGTYLGHGVEPQFVMNIALAAARAGTRKAARPAPRRSRRPWTGRSSQVVVTGVGHWRGEGMALVEAAG